VHYDRCLGETMKDAQEWQHLPLQRMRNPDDAAKKAWS
jgi:hypothetical protein